ncbi:hypothetical protein FEM08_22880 [Flavobacterium gilvum]|nr:hypothetical protein FEM08_22880 [Flavobacterium gilvum]
MDTLFKIIDRFPKKYIQSAKLKVFLRNFQQKIKKRQNLFEE